MKNFTKLIVAAGVGYALRAYSQKDSLTSNEALRHSVDRRLSVEKDSNLRITVQSIPFANRDDATKVLDEVHEIMDQYGFVTVADLFDLIGSTTTFTDTKRGWSDLRMVYVTRTRDGYALTFPETSPWRASSVTK